MSLCMLVGMVHAASMTAEWCWPCRRGNYGSRLPRGFGASATASRCMIAIGNGLGRLQRCMTACRIHICVLRMCKSSAGDPEPDPVTVALSKITSHIGSARKFPKAAGLLRQLLASGSLAAAQHGPAVFAALRAAMAEPARVSVVSSFPATRLPASCAPDYPSQHMGSRANCSVDGHARSNCMSARCSFVLPDCAQADQPELRREYSKLFTAASKAKQLFSASELVELDVYGLWAVLRPQASNCMRPLAEVMYPPAASSPMTRLCGCCQLVKCTSRLYLL
jgi:hypothetical protein